MTIERCSLSNRHTSPGVASLRHIRQRAISKLAGAHYSSAELASWQVALAEQDAEQHWLDSTTFIAVERSKTVGFSQIDVNRGYIEALYVLPNAWHQGHGSALMEEMEAAALAAGRKQLFLSASLNAIGFYEKRSYAIAWGVQKFGAQGSALSFAVMKRIF